jgi:hypothetical protein
MKMKIIDSNSLATSEFIEETFLFWYSDNEHIRSPFPDYIQTRLKTDATEKFYAWVNNLKPEAKDEMNDEIIAEKFEEIIFESALPLIATEDERISILYPFLPRVGDDLADVEKKVSVVTDRIIKKDEDTNFLHLTCINKETGEKWETSFELPA